jgi:uncharacterized protein (DUF433 family)
MGDHVVRVVGVCGGRPTFKYTRIEITGTLDRIATGERIDEIVAGYRGRVSHEAIIEAIQIVTGTASSAVHCPMHGPPSSPGCCGDCFATGSSGPEQAEWAR